MPEVVALESGPQGRASESWDILKQEPSPPELGEQPRESSPPALEPSSEEPRSSEHESQGEAKGQEQQREPQGEPRQGKLSRYERTKRQRAALEQREKAISQREQAIARAEEAKNKLPYTLEELKGYRKSWEKEGNYDLVEKADAEIGRLEKLEADQRQTLEIPRSGTKEFVDQWQAAEKELYDFDPEFQREGTRLDKVLRQMMSAPEGKYYRQHPRGIIAAYNTAKLQITQSDLNQARAEIQQLKQELGRLNGLTSIGGSGGAGRSIGEMRGKDFASLSSKEMRDYLRRNATRGHW